ncbi:hypothetical protein [Paenibacillus guangzhouensis]|uniref:hypothetical protein n=1 Tax=Paenibacillus guangzhouensis TaxID=1473112 RepID=UPI001266985E|nr:hypothetical protein [Paenibacillus guangzhouensis]
MTARSRIKYIRTAGIMVVLTMLALSTTGCLYPKELRAENQVSYRETTLLVQNAVEAFQKEKGILPIITSGNDVPKFEKYRINFEPLVDGKFLSDVPVASYEKGGPGYFIIINEETKPVVKLMDLTVYQHMNDIQKLVDQFAKAHPGTLPLGKELYPDFYEVDTKQLSGKPPEIKSVYSGEPTQIMIDKKGKVYVDYAADIVTAIQKAGGTVSTKVEDLRDYLVDASFYSPVKSTAYHWVNEQPVPVLSN